jgi:hypothetical protein
VNKHPESAAFVSEKKVPKLYMEFSSIVQLRKDFKIISNVIKYLSINTMSETSI